MATDGDGDAAVVIAEATESPEAAEAPGRSARGEAGAVDLGEAFRVLSCGQEFVSLASLELALGPALARVLLKRVDLGGLGGSQTISHEQFCTLIGRVTDAKLHAASHVAFTGLYAAGVRQQSARAASASLSARNHRPPPMAEQKRPESGVRLIGPDRLAGAMAEMVMFDGMTPKLDEIDGKAIIAVATHGCAMMAEDAFHAAICLHAPEIPAKDPDPNPSQDPAEAKE
jgi:hypothetical protein